jgi:dTDP-4-amino-4,6-dideoxygalactose transaminase
LSCNTLFILGVKLKHLEAWTEGRRAAAAAYDRFFEGSGVETPTQVPGNRHVYHVYAIRSPDREAWQQALNEQGIQSGIHYPIPVHLLPAYADLGYAEGDFPESERAAREFLSLPMFPEMTEDQCRTVADAVLKLAGRDLAAAS